MEILFTIFSRKDARKMSDDNNNTRSNQNICDLRDAPDVIEKAFVADRTTTGYIRILITFMMWLFDHHREYLADGVYDMLKEADDKDIQERLNPPKKRRRSYNNKKKKRLGDESELKRPNLRAICRELLIAMKPSFNGSPHNCPIRLEGDVQLTYELIKGFMGLKKMLFLLIKEMLRIMLRKTTLK